MGIRHRWRREQCPISMRFDREAQNLMAGGVLRWPEFNAMVKIEVTRTRLWSQFDLRAIHVVFIAVHDGPERLLSQGPAAAVDAVSQHRRQWLPPAADQEWRQCAFDGCHSARSLGVARRDSVPDTPYVLPTLPANTIEEGKLQIVCLIALPTVRDVDHMPRFQPLVLVDHRHKRKLILAPGHHIPGQGLVCGITFRLERERMADFVGSCRK